MIPVGTLPELCWYDTRLAVAAIKVLGQPKTLCQSHLDDFLADMEEV